MGQRRGENSSGRKGTLPVCNRSGWLGARFVEEAGQLGLCLDEGRLKAFCIYLEELVEWNKVVRLVSDADPEKVVWQHLFDSLTPVRFVPELGRMVDIGSGAGFPGLPIKLVRPGLEVTLVESRRRKANFLRHMIRVLALDGVNVYEGRAEEMEAPLPYDVAISRASAPPRKWIPWAARMVRESGKIIIMGSKSGRSAGIEEMLLNWSLELVQEVEVFLPVVEKRRKVTVLRKRGRFT